MPEYFFIVIHGFLVFKYFQIIRITQKDLKALPLTKPLGLFFILCLSLHLILACSLVLQAYELFKASMWAVLFSVVLANIVLVLSMLFTLYVYSEGKPIEMCRERNWSLSVAEKLAELFGNSRFQCLLGLSFCLLLVATTLKNERAISDWNTLNLLTVTGLTFDALFLVWLALILNGWTTKNHWAIKISDKVNNLMIIVFVVIMNLAYLTAGYLTPDNIISNLKLEAFQGNPWWHSVPIAVSFVCIFFLSWHVFRINKLDKYVEELAHIIVMLAALWMMNYLFTEQLSFKSFTFFVVLFVTFISGVVCYLGIIKLARKMWTPEEAKLKMIHQQLPHLLSSTTNSGQAITVTEQLLSDIFKANISINKPTPRLNAPEEPSQNIVIPGSPHMYMELGYMAGWKPWFSESIKWAIYAGQYLQAHLQVISHSELKHQTSLKVQEISALAYKSEAQALRAQMRPHFLFNTLNTVKYLVVEEPEEAERTIEQLALLLRASISLSENDLVTLGAEMDLVENYLNIEKKRYGRRLIFSTQLPSECDQILVPSFCLQPLVENSVIHGVEKRIEPVTINIWAAIKNNALILTVSDDGPGLDKIKATQPNQSRKNRGGNSGIAIANLQKRLSNIYGSEAKLELDFSQPKGTRAQLRLPVVRSKTNNNGNN